MEALWLDDRENAIMRGAINTAVQYLREQYTYPGPGGVTRYDWHNPTIIHEKIRPGLKERYLKGLTRSKKMERQIIWYMATDGENITDEWRNDSYGQYY